MFEVVALPAFADNYLWLLHRDGRAAVVDPGDAGVVQQALDARGLALDAILLTHHHADHTGGVEALVQCHRCRVIGPRNENIAHVGIRVGEGDVVRVLGTELRILDVPGHTRGHIAYWCETSGQLFCGDTLFGAGCGKLFEGTPAQMWHSLNKIAALPEATLVYCAHEYTLSNLRFARAADPDNPALIEREQHDTQRRAAGLATVPFTIAVELRTNPFLRATAPALKQRAAALERDPEIARQLAAWEPAFGEARSFAALRAWKNVYR